MAAEQHSKSDPAVWLKDHGDHFLLAAWKAHSKFGGRSSIKTWLTIILHRTTRHFFEERKEPQIAQMNTDKEGLKLKKK